MTQKSAKRKSANRKAKPETAEAPAGRPQTCVLLVEDEALIAEIIGEALAESGHTVHAVANAQDAIAHLSNGARVDVLFTDINLPGEIDGVGLAEQARAVNPLLPVLFSSGRWWRLEELQKLPNAATLRSPTARHAPARRWNCCWPSRQAAPKMPDPSAKPR